MTPNGLVIGSDWTVWNCRSCTVEEQVVWVDPVSARWQQRVRDIIDGRWVDCVRTRYAHCLTLNHDLRWVLVNALSDAEMRNTAWLETLPLGPIRGLRFFRTDGPPDVSR